MKLLDEFGVATKLKVYLGLLALVLFSGCAARRSPGGGNLTAEGILSRTGHPVRLADASDDSILPPGVSIDRPLSADDTASIALWNNAQLKANLATLGIARGDLINAGLLRSPRLDVLFPVGIKPLELLFDLPIEALWERPRRVAAAQQAYDQLAHSLIQNGLNTIRDARLAHYDLLQAQRRLEAAKEAAGLRQRILKLMNVRLRVGDVSELETIAARSEAGTAQEQLVRFEHDVDLASQRLSLALGLPIGRQVLQVVEDATAPPTPVSAEALIETAIVARPDLRAAELAIAAAAKRARWERSRLTVLSAQLSSKGSIGRQGLFSGPGLSATLPIFNRNQGLISRADAEVEVASLQYAALKQQVEFEVQQAREQMVQAQEALLRVQEEVVEPAQRAAVLAEEQYQSGDVAYLFVLEQTRGLIDAALRVIDSDVAVRRAQAQLERSVGTR